MTDFEKPPWQIPHGTGAFKLLAEMNELMNKVPFMTKTQSERAEAQQWAEKVQALEAENERLQQQLLAVLKHVEELRAEIERLKAKL